MPGRQFSILTKDDDTLFKIFVCFCWNLMEWQLFKLAIRRLMHMQSNILAKKGSLKILPVTVGSSSASAQYLWLHSNLSQQTSVSWYVPRLKVALVLNCKTVPYTNTMYWAMPVNTKMLLSPRIFCDDLRIFILLHLFFFFFSFSSYSQIHSCI